MQYGVLMKLCVICPATALLTSCGTTTPATPPSFSAQVRDTASEQKLIDCDTLQPEPIPSISQQLIDTLPAKLPGETDFGYRDRLSPSQAGIYDWFQRDIRNGKRWETFCRV